MPSSPTLDQFTAFQFAYDYFNERLFGGRLKPCLLNFRGRSKRNFGLFWANKWANPGGSTHEISLNPELLGRPAREVFGTLVHEMCHQWQQDFGKPSPGGYHNAQWVTQMESVGLIPSSTGKPGGKKTGVQMTHFVAKGGKFSQLLKEMPANVSLPWTSSSIAELSKVKPRQKNARYECRECKVMVTGKPGLSIICGLCDKEMLECLR